MAAPLENQNNMELVGDGGGRENMNGGRRGRNNNEPLLFVDEPERLLHQGRRNAEFQRAVEAAAEELIRTRLAEQARDGRGGPQAPANNQEPPAYRNQYAPPNNPLYLPADDPPPPRQQRRARLSIKENSVPIVANNSWCIEADDEMQAFELRTNIVHFLPKFAGLPGETATQHLKEYEGVCKSFQPYGMTPDKYRLSMFPFSLTDLAKSWFLSLPSGSIRTWDQMQRSFLDKFYPVGKANQIRRELSVIRQGASESLYEYLERFNDLEQGCCNLALTDYQLVNYLMDGLKPIERRMLDAAAGGSVMNLDPDQFRALVKETAESARFTEALARQDNSRVRNVSQVETGNNQMIEEMKEMRGMIRTLMVAQGNGAKPCEQCHLTTHGTDECPAFQIDNQADVNAISGFQQPNQAPKHGLAANGYSWKQGGFPNQQPQLYQPPNQRQNYRNQQQHGSGQQDRPPWEAAITQVAQQLGNQIAAMGRKMDSYAESTSKQIAQLTADMAELKAEKGKLLSQTVPNPKGGVNAITTRSGKQLLNRTDGTDVGKSGE